MSRFPATVALVAILGAVFAIELSRGAPGHDAVLLALGALSDRVGPGRDPWRLLTYGLLHANWVHLLLNVSLLGYAGRIVERRIGSLPTLATFLLGVLGGGVGLTIRAAIHPKTGISIGASAGCFALLACAILLLYRPDAARFGQTDRPRRALLVIALAGIGISFLPGVSLVGHAVGLVVGAAAGIVAPLRPAAPVAPASPVEPTAP